MNTNEVKLAEMSKRIRQLEDALQISHSAVSRNPHPLLAEDLLQIKSGGISTADDKEDDLTDATLVDSFGTLAVSNGAEVYYGAPHVSATFRSPSKVLMVMCPSFSTTYLQ